MEWTSQFKPPYGTPLNPSHWASRGLCASYLFNEGSGKIVNDSSGQGNNGLCVNMNDPPIATSGWVPGSHGGTMAFDGSNDYVTVPNYTNQNYASGTVLWWQNPSSAFNSGQTRGMWGNDYFSAQVYADNSWYVGWNKSGDQRIVFAASAQNSPQNVWSFYAYTWNAAGSILYMNGGIIGTNGTAQVVSNLNISFFIGACSNVSPTLTRFFGLISSVSIYNRALSAEEITYLYAFPWCMYDDDQRDFPYNRFYHRYAIDSRSGIV